MTFGLKAVSFMKVVRLFNATLQPNSNSLYGLCWTSSFAAILITIAARGLMPPNKNRKYGP